jgi:hypothetical protein
VQENDNVKENVCAVGCIFESRDVRTESRLGNKISYSRKLNRDLRMERNVLRKIR